MTASSRPPANSVTVPSRDPTLVRLALALLRRADVSRSSRNAVLRLDAEELPEAYGSAGPDDVERLQLLIGTLEATGWVRLRLSKAKPFETFGDRNPALELLNFDELAAWSGFVSRDETWVRQFVRAMRGDPLLEAVDLGDRREELLDYLLRSPLSALEGLTFAEAAELLAELRRRCRSGSVEHVRQLSAQVFHGRSKILDAREELLRLLGASPGQFVESPVQLLVDVPEVQVSEVLIVENLVTYETMCDNRRPACGWEAAAIVYAAGFRSGARRLRQRGGSRLYWRSISELGRLGSRDECGRFEGWLYGADDRCWTVSFFGDLDFAGMSILASLRVAFPACEAWQPGYSSLLSRLRSGQGHRPQDADKDGQVDPGGTGCRYADEVLLPAMRSLNAFIDQEAWTASGVA